jgi:hypothetical protein
LLAEMNTSLRVRVVRTTLIPSLLRILNIMN